MRWQGKEALGLGVTMVKGGDVIELGRGLDQNVARIQQQLPVGVELQQVASMPRAVQRSINVFIRSLTESVLIVLAVSLVSLGLRTGLVVAVSIPLVLAVTFFFMWLFDIGLHKISLGALILSLGLLVDDAIIAVEMMAIKLEQGYDRFRAAGFAYTSTAFPMLTGTLVTVAGFLPIATARSSTGEYTRSIFQVSAIALIASWVIAVIVIPYLGYRMLPDFTKPRGPSLAARLIAKLRGLPPPPPTVSHHGDPEAVYRTPFYRRLRAVIAWCVGRRLTVIVATLAIFVAALALFRFIPQQFFPSSSRPELLVDLRLAEGSSFAATLEQAKKFETVLNAESGIENYVTYVGSGSPRFYLPLDQQLQQANFAQFVVTANSIADRERVRTRLLAIFDNDFPSLRGRISRLENGPPVGFPVQFRVSGEDIPTVRRISREVAQIMRADPETTNVQFDWDEPSKVIRVAIDQNKARVLGISSLDLATFLNNSLSGYSVTYFRERDKQVEVLLRGAVEERARISFLKDLAIPSRNGRAVPVTQIADIRYELEDGIIWRRDRLPTITVRADLKGDAQGPRCGQPARPGTGENPRHAAARVPDRTGRRDRGFGARPAVHRGGCAAASVHRSDAAHDSAAQLFAHADGHADGAAGVDRRRARAAGLRQAVWIRRAAGNHRACGDHHAQFGHTGRPDRAGHRHGARALGGGGRRDGAPLPPDRIDRRCGGAGSRPAYPQRFLRTNGGSDDGRHYHRHRPHAVVPASTVCELVSRRARRRGGTGGVGMKRSKRP